ncbi:hypothetical protein SH580_21150 [Coraliomargarita algicola]|uniref:XRE family transcriptional regulator n=1 Tax=Coraliomargarita algicola TaxID=3092156 RepID=A0ABZ0RKH8_9BACT|nr:hypothetical protein [Coraliomargarita sp. J2-16]WPJ95926.1 hypothetical protein SH580_21150 [Coraliomargarita sp. J2-16]
MQNEHQRISDAMIERIAGIAGDLKGVPESFCRDFRAWAKRWSKNEEEKSTKSFADFLPWRIEARPYSVTELSRLPGMPGRTRLSKMVNSPPLNQMQTRNFAGKLTPDTVRQLVEVVCEPVDVDLKQGVEVVNEP